MTGKEQMEAILSKSFQGIGEAVVKGIDDVIVEMDREYNDLRSRLLRLRDEVVCNNKYAEDEAIDYLTRTAEAAAKLTALANLIGQRPEVEQEVAAETAVDKRSKLLLSATTNGRQT